MSDALLHLDNQFCFTAYAVARAVSQAYDPLLQELELTYPQYLVMLALWEEDQPNLKRLGERLRLDSGTLTPIIKRLSGKGYLTKQRSAVDERELVIALTPSGRKLRERALGVPHGLLCRLNVPLAKVMKLRDELKELLLAMDAVRPGVGTGAAAAATGTTGALARTRTLERSSKTKTTRLNKASKRKQTTPTGRKKS